MAEDTRLITEYEEKEILPAYLDKFVNHQIQPLNKEETIKQIYSIYERLNKEDATILKKPEIVFCDSPLDCVRKATIRYKEKNPGSSQSDVRNHGDLFTWRCLWTFAWDMIQDRGKANQVLDSMSEQEKINFEHYLKDSRALDYFIPYDDIIYVSEKPVRYNAENHRLHDDTGKGAIVYSDGCTIYMYEGNIIPPKYGSVPADQWDPEWINTEKNVDLRRTLLRRIGFKRWVDSGGFSTISTQYLAFNRSKNICAWVDSPDHPLALEAVADNDTLSFPSVFNNLVDRLELTKDNSIHETFAERSNQAEIDVSQPTPENKEAVDYFYKLGKVVRYDLLSRQDEHLGAVKYLKMTNPSVGDDHLEPVAPLDWITDCEMAMAWRQGFDTPPKEPVVYQSIA